jgi:NAD(P)-dependent dehydrogenase (short-subunit alcohol dehydrogenase family)
MDNLHGKVAVVTGGASGIGNTVAELASRGDVEGQVVDVSDFDAVEGLAEHVFATHGACHLLFDNARVTSGGGTAHPSPRAQSHAHRRPRPRSRTSSASSPSRGGT